MTFFGQSFFQMKLRVNTSFQYLKMTPMMYMKKNPEEEKRLGISALDIVLLIIR
jgi:hypothetical protein